MSNTTVRAGRLRLWAGVLIAVLLAAAGCSSTIASGPAELRSISGEVSDVVPEISEPAGDGELAMPTLAVKQTGIAVVDSLSYDAAEVFGLVSDYDLDDGESLDAPEGHEFVIATLQKVSTRWNAQSGLAAVHIAAGGQQVSAAPLYQAGSYTSILITVQERADVTLELHDQGQVAAMDVRTGQRYDDKIPANTSLYYPFDTSQVRALTLSAMISPEGAYFQVATGFTEFELTFSPMPTTTDPVVDVGAWTSGSCSITFAS